MKDSRGSEHPDVKPLSVTDIEEALRSSGYPLEVELAADLKESGFIPALGRHLLVNAEAREYSEIDIVAERVETTGDIQVGSRLLLQVKRLADNRAFVGVRGEQPSGSNNLSERLQIAGSPSTVLAAQEYMALFHVGKEGLQNALQPLQQLPICVHWAVAYRKGKHVPWASGDPEFMRDLESLVRARREDGLEFSSYCSSKLQVPVLSLVTLALVIDGPLYLYDVATKTAESVGMLTIDQAFGTREGPLFAMIDVVSRAACRTYLKLCLDVDDRLRAGAAFHRHALTKAAVDSHARAKAAAVQSRVIPDELRGHPL